MKGRRNAYKDRVRRNGGADRYGSFQNGKQLSPDIVAGRSVYIPFTYLEGKK